MRLLGLLLIAACASGQITINGGRTITGPLDASGATKTLPAKAGTLSARPATCGVGELYFITDATAGQNISGCTATNTWTLQSGGGTSAVICNFDTLGVTPATPVITQGAAGTSCTASSTAGTGSRPGVVITDNLGQIVKWVSCWTGGATNSIFGGLTTTTAIQDGVATSTNNVTTITFSADVHGYCGVSTGNMGPMGATGASGAMSLTGISCPPASPVSGTVYWCTNAHAANDCTDTFDGTSVATCRYNGATYDALVNTSPTPLVLGPISPSSGTTYCAPFGTGTTACGSLPIYRQVNLGPAYTITALRVYLSATNGSGGNVVFTIYKSATAGTGGSAQSCVVTVPVSSPAGIYSTNCAVPWGAAEFVSIRVDNNTGGTLNNVINNISTVIR